MAGGDYHPYRTDPAVERWQTMHSTMYQRFRFTPKRTRQAALWGLAVPLLAYSLSAFTDNRWDWRAKTREDSILRVAPATAEGADKDE